MLRPSRLSRLVKMIGLVAVPTELILLPRLTAIHDTPPPEIRITPGSMARVTLLSAVSGVAQPTVEDVNGAPALGAVKPPSQPTSTRPFI